MQWQGCWDHDPNAVTAAPAMATHQGKIVASALSNCSRLLAKNCWAVLLQASHSSKEGASPSTAGGVCACMQASVEYTVLVTTHQNSYRHTCDIDSSCMQFAPQVWIVLVCPYRVAVSTPLTRTSDSCQLQLPAP
jgi:hypothetical protein